ncbi:MAG: hypothetical protein AVDCRST_MAG10-2090 [uncultured Acidimicrobiales bacterium]|uniref:Integral membrane protein n=1 Tax=uncultured Acidimicrobiales bacterium TaxID=310071 RepID=A0A6J4IG75_9ACTN|nr:MAG: hypothetical protein AVDCRST_MAG10-2090 [uncultured Acidimicrobiales bacterium]
MRCVTDAVEEDQTTGLRSTVAQERQAYGHGEDRPLGSFVGLMAAYAGAVSVGAVAVRRRGLPERLPWADLALMSVATHKLSRLIAKDPVTSPLRAPFTRFAGTSGEAELAEEVRGTGPRKAMGELVTCPFCVGQWAATGFAFGLVLAPRATRLAAAVLTSLTAADFLQFAYTTAEQRQQG